jgi:hypothetical protein
VTANKGKVGLRSVFTVRKGRPVLDPVDRQKLMRCNQLLCAVLPSINQFNRMKIQSTERCSASCSRAGACQASRCGFTRLPSLAAPGVVVVE